MHVFCMAKYLMNAKSGKIFSNKFSKNVERNKCATFQERYILDILLIVPQFYLY